MRTINYIFQPKYETSNLLIQFDLHICIERTDWPTNETEKQRKSKRVQKKPEAKQMENICHIYIATHIPLSLYIF